MAWWSFLLIAAALIAFLIGSYAHKNLTFDTAAEAKMRRAGFLEKQVTLPDGTVLNYGEGPGGGAPLLLLHGQGVTWENYAKVLPDLTKRFHVFAVDCHGHGESSFNKSKYTAAAMGADFAWFIQHMIGEPCYVSGHSSGGLLTVWLAANEPQWVKGVAIEDAPLFSTEMPEKEQTFAYRYSFRPIHDFLHQKLEPDYLTYVLDNSYWSSVFGGGWPKMTAAVQAYRKKHPGSRPKVWWLPPVINTIWTTMSDPYDLWFGESFYDQSWFAGFDQAEALRRVACPALFLKAATRWQDGMLLAALSEEDAQQACELIPDCKRIDFPKSGHGIHDEQPREFVEALAQLLP